MNNNSRRYKYQPLARTRLAICASVNVLIPVVFCLYAWQTMGFHWAYVVLVAVSAAFAVFSYHQGRRYLRPIEQISEVLRHCARGEFGQRVTQVYAMGEVGKMAWNLNAFLDRCESYFREMSTCFRRAGQQDFDRPALAAGLSGEMRAGIEHANVALRALKQNYELNQINRLSHSLHEQNTENLIPNLKLCQQDMITVTETLRSVVDTARGNAEAADSSKVGIQQINDSMVGISDKVATAADVIGRVSESSKQVIDALSIISDIADQTGLLALNASIEAARAGEMGRGFAVVADEVKALSQRTKDAALQVSETLDSFSAQVEAITREARESVELVESIRPVVEGFRERFEEFNDAAHQTISSVTNAQEISFSTLVKIDHIIYKQNAYIAVNNTDREEEAQAISVDNHNCRLGKWYYEGIGSQYFSHLPSYAALEAPHEVVHSSAHHALDLAHQDWLHNDEVMEGIVAELGQMEAASLEVMNLLTSMTEESIAARSAA
ncbi:MAG TPA: chemotaxis protein [Gammaproteobacteria bacterium]|nr:chemotaxis protein [Gammaproteobacteria bacterium]